RACGGRGGLASASPSPGVTRVGLDGELEGRESRGVRAASCLGSSSPDLTPTEPATKAPHSSSRGTHQVGLWVDWQDQRLRGGLVEVEVADQVAELGGVLAHVGAGVWSSVGLRVESGPAQKVVFDEPRISVE